MSDCSIDDRRPGLTPPQFRLSTLLGLVAVLCAVFAVMGAVGPRSGLALILFLLAVSAHVAGGALGTRLRENGDRPLPGDAAAPLRTSRRRMLAEEVYAPTTRLGQRDSLGVVVVVLTVLGVALGAASGAALLSLSHGARITVVSVVFGALFSGVLGGFAGFLASSFLHVLISAHLQAIRQAKRH